MTLFFPAAIGFPVIIFLLVPLRIWVIPRLPFKPHELGILDGPTASPFVSHVLVQLKVRSRLTLERQTMASVGGTL